MKALIVFIYFVFASSYGIAQNNVVNIIFEVDGKATVYKNAVAEFMYNKDTIRVNVEEGKLAIPESVFKKKVVVER